MVGSDGLVCMLMLAKKGKQKIRSLDLQGKAHIVRGDGPSDGSQARVEIRGLLVLGVRQLSERALYKPVTLASNQALCLSLGISP